MTLYLVLGNIFPKTNEKDDYITQKIVVKNVKNQHVLNECTDILVFEPLYFHGIF